MFLKKISDFKFLTTKIQATMCFISVNLSCIKITTSTNFRFNIKDEATGFDTSEIK